VKALYDLAAPAKLNLFLHITGRRADGYHLLQSVFVLIDWCDHVHLDLRLDGQISREDIRVSPQPANSASQQPAPLPADDLCVRAAQALRGALPSGHPARAWGVHIGLEKRIPQQAGLGGGSSDAATCLLGLNRLWGAHKQLSELELIGLRLGADVPFFLRGRNAWVEGIGEQITALDWPPLQQSPGLRFLVAKPPQGLATADIFRHPMLQRGTPAATIAGFVAETRSGPDWALGWGKNDLQPVAEQLNPEVSQGLQWLRGQPGVLPSSARMTGSGSAVFGVMVDGFTRGSLKSSLGGLGPVPNQPPPGFEARVCSSLQHHPLLGWAAT
jgi:4-diphosphocytidyl-2-C-methyl-D-erythritol kinase